MVERGRSVAEWQPTSAPEHPRPAAALAGAQASLGGARVGPYDLHIDPGEIVALVGPNGAGKTTALHLLLGLRRLAAGTARVAGAPVTTTRPPVGAGVSLLDDGSRPWLTAHQELADIVAVRPGAPGRDQVLALVGLADAAHRRTGEYSAGMVRRLGLARALVGGPRLLVLDEPTASLDREAGAWLGGVLRELAGEGVAVLMATHDPVLLEHVGARLVPIEGCRTR